MDFKETAAFYEQHRYVVITGFLSPEMAAFGYHYGLVRANTARTFRNSDWPEYRPMVDGTFEDRQVPDTFSCYSDPFMETMLAFCHRGMEQITGNELYMTYSYWRMYKTGDQLKRHKDRPSCEISATVCLGYDVSNLRGTNDDYVWPICIDETGGGDEKGKAIVLRPGDMIVYRGCEVDHWREPFLGNRHAQVFLHYNDKNGPFKEHCQFDSRPHLGLPDVFKSPEKTKAIEDVNRRLVEERKSQ